MPGKSSGLRTRLADQNARLMELFQTAGHEYIEPDIIQPADVFLERAGEDLRSRTYVFSDPDGNELCLRPDLTVPTCRFHLSHAKTPETEARYCYNGPAFRHHAHPGQPREIDQLGLEWFGAEKAGEAEAAIFNLTLAAMKEAGLENYSVRIGDLGLFRALLKVMNMPDRWRKRLEHEFWRPLAFHKLLRHLTGEKPLPASSADPVVRRLARGTQSAIQLVEDVLEQENWPLVPGRSAEQIAERLAEKASDVNAMPLERTIAEKINAYLDIHGKPEEICDRICRLAPSDNGAFGTACAALKERLELFDLAAIPGGSASFAAEFGRSLEYYTGFVFQIEVTDKDRAPLVIAGGGRYDNMVSDIGKCAKVPAVGCAIYAQRLLNAVERQAT